MNRRMLVERRDRLAEKIRTLPEGARKQQARRIHHSLCWLAWSARRSQKKIAGSR